MFEAKSYVYYSRELDNLLIYNEADLYYMGSIEGATGKKMLVGSVDNIKKEYGLTLIGEF